MIFAFDRTLVYDSRRHPCEISTSLSSSLTSLRDIRDPDNAGLGLVWFPNSLKVNEETKYKLNQSFYVLFGLYIFHLLRLKRSIQTYLGPGPLCFHGLFLA